MRLSAVQLASSSRAALLASDRGYAPACLLGNQGSHDGSGADGDVHEKCGDDRRSVSDLAIRGWAVEPRRVSRQASGVTFRINGYCDVEHSRGEA